jgi:hypothetical protein
MLPMVIYLLDFKSFMYTVYFCLKIKMFHVYRIKNQLYF